MATCLAALVHTSPNYSKAAPWPQQWLYGHQSVVISGFTLIKSTHLQNGSWASGLSSGQGRVLSKAREYQGKAQVSDGT